VRDQSRCPRLHLLESQRRGALEQPRAGAERERHNVEPHIVDQAGGEVLVEGRAALDRDIAVASSLSPQPSPPSSPNGRSSLWLRPAEYPSADIVMSQITLPIGLVIALSSLAATSVAFAVSFLSSSRINQTAATRRQPCDPSPLRLDRRVAIGARRELLAITSLSDDMVVVQRDTHAAASVRKTSGYLQACGVRAVVDEGAS
jgi:hypothetical protein